MSTLIKLGVYGELNREIANARRKLERLFASRGHDLVITSIREGTHTAGSLHPQGDAFDFRGVVSVPVNEIRVLVGTDYDLVEEGDHLHLEWDPK